MRHFAKQQIQRRRRRPMIASTSTRVPVHRTTITKFVLPPSTQTLQQKQTQQTLKHLSVTIPNSLEHNNGQTPSPIGRHSDYIKSRNNPIYLGTDIHAYTNQINEIAAHTMVSHSVPNEAFELILTQMHNKYGHKEVFQNLRNVFRQGSIIDPQVPHINFAFILKQLWEKLVQLNEDSAFDHFGETLDQIGMTCIQGVTHRLLIDHHAFVE
jgi:hypothetical protein